MTILLDEGNGGSGSFYAVFCCIHMTLISWPKVVAPAPGYFIYVPPSKMDKKAVRGGYTSCLNGMI